MPSACHCEMDLLSVSVMLWTLTTQNTLATSTASDQGDLGQGEASVCGRGRQEIHV